MLSNTDPVAAETAAKEKEAALRREADEMAWDLGKTLLIALQQVFLGKAASYEFPVQIDNKGFAVTVTRSHEVKRNESGDLPPSGA